MPQSLDQIIPSLQAFGVGVYWVLLFAAMGEAVIFVGIVLPGSLMVIAGGFLVRAGTIDFFDLAWFAGIGAIIGAEISFRLGRLGAAGLEGKSAIRGTAYMARAKSLLGRYGGFAMVVARFLGPVSAFVPVGCALAGMPRRKFIIWNVASAVPYALILPAIGYFMGDLLAMIGPLTGRVLLVLLLMSLTFGLLWFLANRIRRNLPNLLAAGQRLHDVIAQSDVVQALAMRFPRMSDFIAHRFDTTRFSGLTATLLGAAGLYVASVYFDSVMDFIQADTIVAVDRRVAALLFALRDPMLISVFSYVTAFGDATVISVLLAGSVAAFVLRRQWAAALGMVVAVAGNVATVALLKSLFSRPRPTFAYYAETSGSFPSGHAAISVAFYGILAFTLWRQRLLDPILALFLFLLLAFAVSLSRVYLVVHYLSDVANGALVGAMWVLIAIAVSEWWRSRSPASPATADRVVLPALAVVASVLFAGYSVATYSHPLADRQAPEISVVSNPDAIPGLIPMTTQTLMGAEGAAISLIFLTPTMDGVAARMTGAGWTNAPVPGLSAAIRGALDDDAPDEPLTPGASVFWNSQPVAVVLTTPIIAGSSDLAILRLWRSSLQSTDGTAVVVGSLQIPGTADLRQIIGMVQVDAGVAVQLDPVPVMIDLRQ